MHVSALLGPDAPFLAPPCHARKSAFPTFCRTPPPVDTGPMSLPIMCLAHCWSPIASSENSVLVCHEGVRNTRLHLVIPSLLRQGRFLLVCAPGPLHKETKLFGIAEPRCSFQPGWRESASPTLCLTPPLVDRSVDVSNYMFITVRAPLHVHRTAMWFPTRV